MTSAYEADVPTLSGGITGPGTSENANLEAKPTKPARPKNKKSSNKKNTKPRNHENSPNLPLYKDDHVTTNSIFSSEKFEDSISVLFGNIQGLASGKQSEKLTRLSKLSTSDHLICLNETNLSETDSVLLVKAGLGEICTMKSLDHVTYKNGKRAQPTKNGAPCRKRSGFGTAMISARPDVMKLNKCEHDHELVFSNVDANGIHGLIITGYRSPSSRDEQEINDFYTAIHDIIVNSTSLCTLDFIIFVGDDNASLTSSNRYSVIAARKMIDLASKHQMVGMIEGLNTRGTNQPDSCFAFFDPETIDISVSSLSTLETDHDMLQIKITKSNIIAEIPKFKKMRKIKMIATHDDLRNKLEAFTDKWCDLWKRAADRKSTEEDVNKACADYIEGLQVVYDSCFREVHCNVHVKGRKSDSDTDLNILRLRAKIQKLAFQVKRDGGDNLQARENLLKTNDELRTVIKKESLRQFQDDMEKQVELEECNVAKFWDLTGSLLNKAAYQTSYDREPTQAETNLKLDKIDMVFTRKKKPDLDAYKNVLAENKYVLEKETDKLSEMIKQINKIMPCLKNNAKTLAEFLSRLAIMMQSADHFPEICNRSRCTFIGKSPKDRAIFSLETVPKLVETIVKKSFDDVKKEDGTMQMAYTKDRGTVSCNAVTLQHVELCEEPTIQNQQDLKKEFYRFDRETVEN